MEELKRVQVSYNGNQFREGSFFDKIARQTLTPEQLSAYRARTEEAREHRGRVQREYLIIMLERQVVIRPDKRHELAALLKENVRAVREGPDDIWAYVLTASRIPEEKYRQVLSDDQWRQLELLFNQAEHRRTALEQSGALEPLEEHEGDSG
jgi:hypothetical protein